MPNSWQFNTAFANIGNSFANAIQANAERKRQQDEQHKLLEEKQNQQNLIQNLFMRFNQGGTMQPSTTTTLQQPTPQPPAGFTPNFNPNLRQPYGVLPVPTEQPSQRFAPDTQADKARILQQLITIPGGSKALDDFQQIQKMLNPEPKKQKTVSVVDPVTGDKKYYLENPLVENQPVGEPLWTEPAQKEKVYRSDSKYAIEKNKTTGQETILENELNTINAKPYTRMLSKNPNIGYNQFEKRWEDMRNGKAVDPMKYVTKTEKKANIEYISKDVQKILDNHYKTVLDLKSKLATVSNIGQDVKDEKGKVDKVMEGRTKTDALGMITTEQIKMSTLQRDLERENNIYVNSVKANLTPEASEAYGKLRKTYGNKDPEYSNQFWDNMQALYKKGAFKKKVQVKNKKTGEMETVDDPGVAAMQGLRELHRALYGDYPDYTESDSEDNSTDDNNVEPME